MTPLLSLNNVSYSYLRSAPVVRNVTCEFRQGERTVILGANGTGKSTLLSLLNGLVFAQQGEVRAFGNVLSEPGLLMDLSAELCRDFPSVKME